MQIPSSQPENSSQLPESTVEKIINGKTTISFVSSHANSQSIDSKEYEGTEYIYDITLPNPTGNTWNTELRAFFPSTRRDDLPQNTPSVQISILTGNGYMPISRNTDIQEKIYEEIHRQVQTPQEDPVTNTRQQVSKILD